MSHESCAFLKYFCSDCYALLGSDRGTRKRQQVENVRSVLAERGLATKSLVVDFGSGSGNLCLALASAQPNTSFLFVDQNQTSLGILAQRARQAGLANVAVMRFRFTADNLREFVERVSSEHGDMDLGIGLHSCGSFTYLVLDVCR